MTPREALSYAGMIRFRFEGTLSAFGNAHGSFPKAPPAAVDDASLA